MKHRDFFARRSERGFGVVAFLALLPLLVSIVALIAAAALLLKADSHLKHECRVSVLNSQRKVAESLRDLMKMNPGAKALRTEMKAAQLALETAMASGAPPAIAAAELNVTRVKLEQVAYGVRQLSLLGKGKLGSLTAPRLAKASVLSGLAKEATENHVALPPSRSTTWFASFDVVAEPKGDLTPDYNPSSQFARKQIVDVDVDVELSPLLPEWLRALLPTGGLNLNSHCQSTIEQKEDEWIETLKAVK